MCRLLPVLFGLLKPFFTSTPWEKNVSCVFVVVTKILPWPPTFKTLTSRSGDGIDNQRRLTSVLAGHGSQAWPAIPAKSADLKSDLASADGSTDSHLCIRLANLIQGALFKLLRPAYTSCFLCEWLHKPTSTPAPAFDDASVPTVLRWAGGTQWIELFMLNCCVGLRVVVFFFFLQPPTKSHNESDVAKWSTLNKGLEFISSCFAVSKPMFQISLEPWTPSWQYLTRQHWNTMLHMVNKSASAWRILWAASTPLCSGWHSIGSSKDVQTGWKWVGRGCGLRKPRSLHSWVALLLMLLETLDFKTHCNKTSWQHLPLHKQEWDFFFF